VNLEEPSMQNLTRALIQSSAHALLAALMFATGAALAQSPAAVPEPGAKGPPTGFVAPAEPKPDETEAQRAKSQPGNNAPFWRGVRESGNQAGVVNLPGAEQGVLIQPFVQYPGSRLTSAGEAWRQVRDRWILPYGGALLVIVLLALAIFYWGKGPLGKARNDGTPMIERFTPFERAAHWTNASAFVVLAVSGVVMAFGKFFLLPVIGSTLFGWLAYALKNAHNFVGPLFAVSLLIVIVTFIRSNLPAKGDLRWLSRMGGMMGEHEVPSHRFNAGEKVVFWFGAFVLGLVSVGSGLFMDKLIPGLAYLRTDMQVAHMIHAVAAVLIVVVFMAHIYLGTIGTRGAFRGMKTGYVDADWAAEHHELWYDDVKAGKIPAQRSAEVPPALNAAARQA
jgi:formate dehydrogenase subunit gamma